jgi:hypothetical protein
MADEAKRRSRINIDVSERDIERARRNDSYTCVVAQAIAHAVPDATHLEVDSQTIRFTRGGIRYLYLTPYAVQGYIVAFDAGDEIRPFSFQLRDPRKIRRHLRTEAGKAIERARIRDKRRPKAAPAGTVNGEGKSAVADTKASATAKKPAAAGAKKESVISGKAGSLAEVKAAYADATKSKKVPDDGTSRRAPPRVFKKKRRLYGYRLLRINRQATEAVEDEEE